MKIFGVGMNYLQHTRELDGEAYKPAAPVVFAKTDSSLLKNGKPFFVPDWSERVDYEAEVVVRICRLGKSIAPQFASRYYDAVTVGIDFTARDLQQEARQKGLPWTLCKAFDNSAAIGRWLPLRGHGQDDNGDEGRATDAEDAVALPLRFRLDLNGTTVQQGDTAEMVYGVDHLVSYLSRYFTLRTGDLLFTGTPAGVGPVHIGDHLEGYIGEQRVLDFYCR